VRSDGTVKTTDRQNPKRPRNDRDWDRLLKITWTVIGWVLLGLGALWLLGRLWTMLLPLLIGLLIVFFLRPPVEWLVRHKVPRLAAVALCYVLALALLAGVGVLVAPTVARQTAQLTSSLPDYAEQLQDASAGLWDRYEELLPPWAHDAVDDAVENAAAEVGGVASAFAAHLLTAGRSVVGLVTGLMAGLFIGFYLLYTLPGVGPGIVEAMPPGWRRDVREASSRVEDTVGGFVRGQVIIMAAVGLMTWLGMWLIGMPYAGFIGATAGLLDLIPYLGPIAAALLAIVIGLFTEPMLAVWAIVVMIVVQQIETNLIRPKVMSDQVGLHPVVVILAVIGGTALFGFIGLLLAVPVVGVVKALYGFYAEKQGWEPGRVAR
jgi:predicted PurR-regulated permease PerM